MDRCRFASAWLAIAHLKLGKTADAKQVLDRVFKEVPLRTFPAHTMHGVAFVNVTLAQVHLASGDPGQLLVDGLARAKALGDMPTLAFAEQRYGQYLGVRGQSASTSWRRFSRDPNWHKRCLPMAASAAATIGGKDLIGALAGIGGIAGPESIAFLRGR